MMGRAGHPRTATWDQAWGPGLDHAVQWLMLMCMNDVRTPSQEAPQWLLDMLEESEADLSAGRTSPWPEALARLEALNAELDAEQAKREA